MSIGTGQYGEGEPRAVDLVERRTSIAVAALRYGLVALFMVLVFLGWIAWLIVP